MSHRELTMRDIYLARYQIGTIARRTPLVDSPYLSNYNARVLLKLEGLQVTGSFKIRGAANKLRSLSEDERACGVITVSSGNHGRAVSYVAGKLGIHAVVVLSEAVPRNKVQSIQELGAEIVIAGKSYDEANEHAARLQERGLTMVHPFDDPFVIAGQGTIGLEMMEDYPEIDTIIVPLSGGGLLGGIAFTIKTIFPAIRVIGVSMERGPAMVESLKAGRIVDVIEEPTLADALAGGIGPENIPFKLIQEYVDETVLVSEGEIAAAMTFALEKHHVVIEGGGAVGIAALLFNKVRNLGSNVAVVASGSNVDLPVLIKATQDRLDYPGGE